MDEIETINAFAIKEGWAIFDYSEHGIRIERDDEAGIFPDDEAAIAHVTALANSGSTLHKAALRIHRHEPDEQQHTPGPWTAHDQGHHIDIMGGGNWIATVHGGYDGDAENARLIAAAPDLLAALREAVKALNHHPNFGVPASEYGSSYHIASVCDRAIAKAEGK